MRRMKKICLLLVMLSVSQIGLGQIVNIPDTNFKTALLESSDTYPNRIARDLNWNFIAVDANNDGEIQNSEAENIRYLYVPGLNISSFEGLQAFINIDYLVCGSNNISSIDISTLTELREFQCSNANLTSIDFSNNLKLENIHMANNQLTTVDISHLHNANFIDFNYNELRSLFLKTGSEPHVVFVDNPVEYVCAEDSRVAHYEQYLESFVNCTDCTVNSYCSFTPGGDFYTFKGEVRLDLDGNGCDTNDALFPNLKLNIDNGTLQDFVVNDATGLYDIPLQAGTYQITPVLEGSDYFQINPSTITVEFPADGTPFVQDFCIVPIGIKNDLEISIVPLEEARPGFETDYKILYKNKGNTTLSGNVEVLFNENYMSLHTAIPTVSSQASGNLSWSYSDLGPFESGEIFFTMTLNTPTDPNYPLNGGDVLDFEVTIKPTDNDETPEDNTLEFNQEVVNSFDPNDITCLEGNVIAPDNVGDYLHYLVRFENTGTASAVNVVIKDVLDTSKFDISSLVPLDASHSFYVRKKDENVVEFIFENIQLPFDDANNDGYVLFKVKTLGNLVIGDLINNEADIFFDFNLPIHTNTAQTEVADNYLSTENEESSVFAIYPNPTDSKINVKGRLFIDELILLDLQGRLVKKKLVSNLETQSEIDVSNLSKGIYFLKINASNTSTTRKVVVE